MLILHPGIVVNVVLLSLRRSWRTNAYMAVDVSFQILDTLMGGIFALDVYRHGHPVKACNLHYGSKVRSALNLRLGAQVEDLCDAQVTDPLRATRCHVARVRTAEDAPASHGEGGILRRCIATDVAEVEYTVDGDEWVRGQVHEWVGWVLLAE